MHEYLALSENGFLFDTRSGHTYSLSRTGTFLLRALLDGAPRDTLTSRLVDSYEVDEQTASRDVERFLFRLKDLDILGERDAADDEEEVA